jgi:hypothetical protein
MNSLAWGMICLVAGLKLLELILAWVFRPRYVSRQTLLTPGESGFYPALVAAVPRGIMICPKVRLADLVDCRWGNRKAFQRIAAKHVDFVLADPDTCRILLAIELDDRSHLRKDRRQRDRFLNDALASAGIPLLRVRTSRRYDQRDLREAIHDRLRQLRAA